MLGCLWGNHLSIIISTLPKPASTSIDRPVAPARKSGVAHLAALLALVATYVCVRILFWGHMPPPLNVEALNPFLVHFSGGVDTTRQRHGHLEAVALIAALVLLAPLLSRFARAFVLKTQQLWIDRFIGVVLCVFFFLSVFWWGTRSTVLTLGLLAVPLMYLYRRGLGSPAAIREFRFIAGTVIVLAVLPGVFAPYDLSGNADWGIELIQTHYALVVGHGDRLAAVQRLFESVIPGYGVLLPVMLGGWQQHVKPIDMGGYVSLIRWIQAGFIVAMALLFRQYAHGWKFAALMAVAFIVPWYHFNQTGLSFPNHTPWRLLGQPVGLFALFLLRRSSLPVTSYWLGVTAGALLLLNFETGACMTIGLITYLWFRFRFFDINHGRSLLTAVPLFLLGGGTTFLAFMAGSRLWLGYWPNLAYLPVMWQAASFVASTGYSGAQGAFNPLAALIFGHASYVLIGTALAARDRLGFKQALRAAVAAAIILWFAYYANRAESWNLVTLYGLYAFFFIDLIQMLMLRFRKGRPTTAHQIVAAALVAIVLVPEMFHTFFNIALPNYRWGLDVMRKGSAIKPARLVSGVYLAEDVAAELEQKAAFIKAASQSSPAVYFTANSFLIPKLSGVLPPLPFSDTFTEVVTKKDYKKLIALVLKRAPERIYFDAPGCRLTGGKGWRLYYQQLRQDLSEHYEKQGEDQGWEIWVRRSAHIVRSPETNDRLMT